MLVKFRSGFNVQLNFAGELEMDVGSGMRLARAVALHQKQEKRYGLHANETLMFPFRIVVESAKIGAYY